MQWRRYGGTGGAAPEGDTKAFFQLEHGGREFPHLQRWPGTFCLLLSLLKEVTALLLGHSTEPPGTAGYY